MCINFRNNNKSKEELKIHIIENLLDKKFKEYGTSELKDSMLNYDGNFNKIYNWICKHVFD